MLSQAQSNQHPKATTVRRGILFLRHKLTKLLPPMWYNNDLDTYHIIRDRAWFLRENRFLFFTRNGPVEITLKPTTVLVCAMVCMVGISVIFLSTVFASYSAIEVMRDESIQTAEASITATDKHSQRTTVTAMGDKTGHDTVTRQGDFTLYTDISNLNGMIAGKTATDPQPLASRFNTQPLVNAPSPQELSGNTIPERLPVHPEIVNFDNKQDILPASMPPKNPLTKDNTDNDEMNIPEANASGSILQSDVTDMDLAFTATPARQTPRRDRPANEMPDQIFDLVPGSTIINAPLPESNSAEYTSPNSRHEDSLVRTAAGFAIAMLPRLFSDPDHTSPNSEEDKTQLPASNVDDTAVTSLDDGFAITAYSSQTGALLPSISDAARAQKMLLSLDGEINFIRKSIRQLGINADYLPNYDTVRTNTKDTNFKQMLITLAEHRAALRKIPFKTPMLYFYISSEYGYRKHPKTGLKTFHHGIDLAGTWQENVRSTAPGTVVFAGNEGAFGKVVRIEHSYGISTLYAHLSRITVRVGDYVGENAVIGKMGNTGRSAGAHLHYEIQVNGKSVDPSDFFTIGRQMSVAGELRQTSLTD